MSKRNLEFGEPEYDGDNVIGDVVDQLQAENTQLRADLARVEGERQSIDQQTQTACRLFKEEMSKAMASLSPRADHETLCGAIRNLQQAHLSEKGNAEAAEASLTRLRLQYAEVVEVLEKLLLRFQYKNHGYGRLTCSSCGAFASEDFDQERGPFKAEPCSDACPWFKAKQAVTAARALQGGEQP